MILYLLFDERVGFDNNKKFEIPKNNLFIIQNKRYTVKCQSQPKVDDP